MRGIGSILVLGGLVLAVVVGVMIGLPTYNV